MQAKELRDLIVGIASQLSETGFPQKVFAAALTGDKNAVAETFEQFSREQPELHKAITEEFSNMSFETDDENPVFAAKEDFCRTQDGKQTPIDGMSFYALFFLAGRNDEGTLFQTENFAERDLLEKEYEFTSTMLGCTFYPTAHTDLYASLACWVYADKDSVSS